MNQPSTFKEIAEHYSWGTLFPLPRNKKTPPPKDVTGANPRPVDSDLQESWAGHRGNVGLKMSDGEVGIDVDEYSYLDPRKGGVYKSGMKTLRQLEMLLGPLPDTWVSTGRGFAEGSGIRMFRLPDEYHGTVVRQSGGSCVDIIRSDHRYAVVWPSVVFDDKGERTYQWYTPEGEVSDTPPTRDQLAELPGEWAEWLAQSETGFIRDPLESTTSIEIDPDEIDPEYARQHVREIVERLKADLEDALLLEEGETNEKGAGWEKTVANAAYYLHRAALTPHSGYDESAAEAEFYSIVPDAMKVTDSYTAKGKWADQADAAALKGGPFNVLTEAQMAAREFAKVEPIEEPQVAGETPTQPWHPDKARKFDPDVVEAEDLTRAIAKRVSEELVFVEEQQSWYMHDYQRHVWRRLAGSASQGARSALSRLSDTMPRGRRDSEDPLEKRRAMRWVAVTAPSRRGGTAASLVDYISATNALRLDDLSTRPDHLWAGGWCWDLRASKDQPRLAEGVSPVTPHLHTAAVMPEKGETPLFDVLLEAMFPDDEMRRYVWHLFGASLTGYSDRMLCVAFGETGVGKTTIISLISDVMGDYAQPMASKLLDPTRCTEFDRMDLLGVRLAFVDEGPRDNRSGQEHLKELTGGSPVRGAAKGKPSVQFRPTHTLWFTDNREPNLSDPAVLDRVRAVPVDAERAAIDSAVSAIRKDHTGWLLDEGPGILAKLMQCAAEYLEDRSVCDMPEALQLEMQAVARTQDPVQVWLDECTEDPENRDDWTLSKDLYTHFRAHALSQGTPASLVPNARAFGTALGRKRVASRKSDGLRKWGLRVKDEAW